jgi:hypothetical protein
LHGVSKLEILIHKKHIPESIPPIAGILLINNKDKVYGIFLNEKEYEIPAIKDLDSYINKYHFEKYPKFSIKKNFINFIGAYEIIVNNRNFMITCNNTLLLYNTSILEFEKKFPNLAAKYPFRNGTLFQEIIIKGELRYQKRGLPFFSI